MAKNIIIFPAETGQAGGITFDEARTNIYKPYPACHVVQDSEIDPSEQVAFYDPGLGSVTDCGHLHGKIAQILFNIASRATGLGITRNIVDCYAPLIRLYRDGDRSFLIGFSLGAFTVRSLGGALSFCGSSRRMPSSDVADGCCWINCAGEACRQRRYQFARPTTAPKLVAIVPSLWIRENAAPRGAIMTSSRERARPRSTCTGNKCVA